MALVADVAQGAVTIATVPVYKGGINTLFVSIYAQFEISIQLEVVNALFVCRRRLHALTVV